MILYSVGCKMVSINFFGRHIYFSFSLEELTATHTIIKCYFEKILKIVFQIAFSWCNREMCVWFY